jgi:hypothetical protein
VESDELSMKGLWFFALMCTICLEGLGRKYVPAIPGFFFYFVKDAVLLVGWFRFRPPEYVNRVWRSLYGGFRSAWVGALAWTLLEMVNPSQDSFLLGAIGLRAYWLWWMAPMVIAGVLQDPVEKRRAIYVLSFLAIGISILAMVQFVSPPSSDVNIYAYVDGEAVRADSATVYSTGRARVASTFSYISGFSDFSILVPALLLSLGLGTTDPKPRRAALAGALAAAAALPMAGSRSSLVLGGGVLLGISWSAGLFFTGAGRRVLIGAVVGMAIGTVAFPEALQGVQDRFSSTEETQGRFLEALQILPPVAIATGDYPVAGMGTGMQQNARWMLHLPAIAYAAENENQRLLIELGPLGFILVWLSKVGLVVFLLKCRGILKRAGKGAASGAALAYAWLTFLGNFGFDHVWQALFFAGVGFIFSEVLAVMRAEQEAKRELPAAT